MEDTISIMQLITHGIPSHYSRIKIINSHLGGALPMLLQWADNQYPGEAQHRGPADVVGHRRARSRSGAAQSTPSVPTGCCWARISL
jgi:hypothetical protein